MTNTKHQRSTTIGRLAAGRDNYICQLCGEDTRKLQKLLSLIYLVWTQAQRIQSRAKHIDMSKAESDAYNKYMSQLEGYYDSHPELMIRKKRHTYDIVPRLIHANAWEIDHKVSLATGGTDCLDNLQTLCTSCHATKTRQLHDELKKRRKREKKRIVKNASK